MGTQNLNLTLPPFNSANWNSPVNANFSTVDAVFGNTLNLSLAGSDKILTLSDLLVMRVNLSGANGGNNISIIFPDGVGGSWIVTNNTDSKSTGVINLRTSNYTVAPIVMPKSGSVFIYSDGKNLYSSVSGTEGAYLPLTGGTIDGPLGVNKDLTVAGDAHFKMDALFEGLVTLKDVVISGAVSLTTATISVLKFSINGFQLTGSLVFGVMGDSKFEGDMTLGAGDLEVTLGNLALKNQNAAHSLGGKTTIPSGAGLLVAKGASFTVEDGAALSLAGTFKPTSIATGDITSTTKIVVTGDGGVDTGKGGLKSGGPMSVAGAASFAGVATFDKQAKFVAGIDGGSGSKFSDPVITSGGSVTSAHWANGVYKAMVSLQTNNLFGLFPEGNLDRGAYLNLNTGKWTASGGVGIGVDGPVTQALAAAFPASVYRTDGPCEAMAVDVEDVLMALANELSAVRGELAAVKAQRA